MPEPAQKTQKSEEAKFIEHFKAVAMQQKSDLIVAYTSGGKSTYYRFSKGGDVFKLQDSPELQKALNAPMLITAEPKYATKQPTKLEKGLLMTPSAPNYLPPYTLPPTLGNLPLPMGPFLITPYGSVMVAPALNGFTIQGSGAGAVYETLRQYLQPATQVPKISEYLPGEKPVPKKTDKK